MGRLAYKSRGGDQRRRVTGKPRLLLLRRLGIGCPKRVIATVRGKREGRGHDAIRIRVPLRITRCKGLQVLARVLREESLRRCNCAY